jgi:hypothetical protein
VIWLYFGEMMASVAATAARNEAEAARAAAQAEAYAGPLRSHTDVIDVEARVIDDPLALAGPEEIAP